MPGKRGGEGDGGCPGQRPSGRGNVCMCVCGGCRKAGRSSKYETGRGGSPERRVRSCKVGGG